MRAVREKLKSTLDRRYATKQEVSTLTADLTTAIASHEAAAKEALRLATECARAIERASQAEILLWQAIDSLSEPTED